MAAAAAVQAAFAAAIWWATRLQARMSKQIYELQSSIEKHQSKVELVPVIEMPPGEQHGMPVLSVGNATAAGCRVLEVILIMERAASGKEHARKESQYCPITGTGIIPGFGELKIYLSRPIKAMVFAVWKGPDNTSYPDVKISAVIRFIANDKRDEAKSGVYSASWVTGIVTEKPPESLQWLKLLDE